MNPDPTPKAEELFAQLLDILEPERTEALDRLCSGDPAVAAEVRKLLECLPAAESFFAQFSADGDESVSLLEGRQVGVYRITGDLGRGGMGAVYRAERHDGQFTRQVAVKIVSLLAAGSDAWRRFEREKRLHAALMHPNIAQLLDAGVSGEGIPYLVMELVEGTRIDIYCRDRKLSIPARIRLFLRICDAVDFIHRNLIVHRDIKPGNILVTPEGVPKLLDFGISRVLSTMGEEVEATAPECRLMTLPYSSPEQVRGDPVSTSCDIYSLGLLLYELLAGRPAYSLAGSSTEDMLRQVLEQDPPAPGVDADLDQVVMKSIRKVAGERYASARELAADLENYLTGRPVTARPATNLYRVSKWVRRHRLPVAVGAAAGVALIASGAAIVWQMQVARREHAIAQRRFQDVRKLANSILFEFHDPVSKLAGATEIRRLMVARAVEYLDSLAKDARGDVPLQLELASAYMRLGEVQGSAQVSNLGDRQGALSSYTKARTVLETALGDQPANRETLVQMGRLLNLTGMLLADMGQPDASVATKREAVGHWERLARETPLDEPEDENVQRGLGSAYYGLGNATHLPWQDRINYWNQAMAIYEKRLQAQPSALDRMRSVALVHKNLSAMYETSFGKPDLDRSIEHAQRAVELDERRVQVAPEDAQARLDLAFSLSMLATGWNKKDEVANAIDCAKQSVEIRRALYQADPKDHRARDRLAYGLYLVGHLSKRQRNWRNALAYLREAVEHSEALAHTTDFWGSWDTLGSARLELAEVHESLRSGKACAEYERAAEAFRRLIRMKAPRRIDPQAALTRIEPKLASCRAPH